MMIDEKKRTLNVIVKDSKSGKFVCSFSVFYFEPSKIKLMLEIGYQTLKKRGVI